MAQSHIPHTQSRKQIRHSESFFSQNYRCKFSESGLLSLRLKIIMSFTVLWVNAHTDLLKVCRLCPDGARWIIQFGESHCGGAQCAALLDRIKEWFGTSMWFLPRRRALLGNTPATRWPIYTWAPPARTLPMHILKYYHPRHQALMTCAVASTGCELTCLGQISASAPFQLHRAQCKNFFFRPPQ
jgi:hypothetical protein